jgi:hypothetical protein
MVECYDYKCAKKKLADKKLISGGYYILAGIGEDEGVIITRDRASVVNYTEIEKGKFIVQTN